MLPSVGVEAAGIRDASDVRRFGETTATGVFDSSTALCTADGRLVDCAFVLPKYEADVTHSRLMNGHGWNAMTWAEYVCSFGRAVPADVSGRGRNGDTKIVSHLAEANC